MFDIFVKRKKIVLDFFTVNPAAYGYAKPVKATRVLPSWFKDMPKKRSFTVDEVPRTEATVKRCPGLIDYYSSAIALTSWFVAEMEIHPEGKVAVHMGRGGGNFHEHERWQYENYVKGTTGRNLKLGSPWHIKSKPNIKVLLAEPTWNNYSHYGSISVLPGILDLRYTDSTHINMMTRPGSNTKTISFEPGDPLAFLIPLTDDDFTIQSHLISELEYAKMGFNDLPWGMPNPSDQSKSIGIRYHRRITDKLKRIYGEEI